MDKFRFIMSNIWDFLKPIVLVFLSDIGPVLIKAATSAVAEMAKTELTGEQKKEKAFEAVQSAMIAEGATVATHVINTTIETAVAKLKSDGA